MDISSMSGVLSVCPIHLHCECAPYNPPFRTMHTREHSITYVLRSHLIQLGTSILLSKA